MRERRGEVVCFTPALLVTAGRMPFDPAQEFIARFNVGADSQPFCVELSPAHHPFFSGLGVSVLDGKQIDWDRRLYAAPIAIAESCFNFIGGIGIHGDDFYASAVTYELTMPDPTASLIGSGAQIPLHVFGVLIRERITYLAPAGHNPPYVTTVPAAEHIPGFKISPVTEHDLKRLRGDT
jgi:hypothetical protein